MSLFDGVEEYEDTDATAFTNEELRRKFIDWIEDNTAQNTINFYRRNFQPFYDEAQSGGYHLVEDITHKHVKTFLKRETETYAPTTVRHRFSAISRFYSVLRSEIDLMERKSPTDRINRQSIDGLSEKTLSEVEDNDEFNYLSEDEADALLNNVPRPEQRNRVLVRLALNTGLRGSEVVRVKMENIDIQRNKLTTYSPKDDEMIDVHWRSDALSDEIDGYLSFSRAQFYHAAESPYLFPTKQSDRMQAVRFSEIVAESAENAGIQEVVTEDAAGNERRRVGGHITRHTFAMQALETGMNVKEIKEALNHSKIETTMRYLEEHEQRKREAIRSKGPTF